MGKVITSYLTWYDIYQTLPKTHRYTLGHKIDNLFMLVIEAISPASFLKRDQQLPYIRIAVQKIDTIKTMLIILWKTKSINNGKYIAISEKVNEIGRLIGGWHGKLITEKNNKKTSA